jgi:hypothetical protein
MVVMLPFPTVGGKSMVVFLGFITRTTSRKSAKKVYGKGYGARWWGSKNPKVTFHTINDHVFEKKRLLLQDHDENVYDPTMTPTRKQKSLWY